MTTDLPVLGAALTVQSLERHHNWIMAERRDLELQDFVSGSALDGDWQTPADRAKGLLDGHEGRVGIHGPFWGLDIAAQDRAIRDVVSRRMLQGLTVCDHLGATCMVIHSPYKTWDYNNFDQYARGREERIENAHATLGPAVKRAEEIGVTLVIENIEDKDPEDRKAMAASFDSPAVRLSIDTGHAYYAERSTGAPPVDYFVKSAGAMLEHMHLQDADGYADRHWAPGEGTMNWQALFMAISALDHQPRLILELRDHDKVLAGAGHLAALGLAR